MRKILVSDFTIKEAPHGGSEWVNQVIIDKFNLEFEYSSQLNSWDPDAFYVISNVSLMKPELVREIPKLNYIIIENDYKICASRHPWRYPNSIVPLTVCFLECYNRVIRHHQRKIHFSKGLS